MGKLARFWGPLFLLTQLHNGGMDSPWGLTFGPDNHLYVSNDNQRDVNSNPRILRFDGQTGALLEAFYRFSGGRARGLTFGPDNQLYLSEAAGDAISRIDVQTDGCEEVLRSTDPGIDRTACVNGLGQRNMPEDMVLRRDGNFYVSSGPSDMILRYDSQTGAFLNAFVPMGSGGLRIPTGLTFGPDEHLYVSSAGSNQILRFHGTTGAFLGVFVAARQRRTRLAPGHTLSR